MTKAYNSIQNIDKLSGGLFKDIAKNLGFFDQRFLTNWGEIIGEELSNKCSPAKIVYDNLSKTATLLLYSEDLSFKSMFSHYKETILSKIKFYFGINFITDVKIIKINK